jgi:hypothetical protein
MSEPQIIREETIDGVLSEAVYERVSVTPLTIDDQLLKLLAEYDVPEDYRMNLKTDIKELFA